MHSRGRLFEDFKVGEVLVTGRRTVEGGDVSRFAGLTGESDPMVGHRLPVARHAPTDGFSIPQAGGPDCRLSGLPQFVTVQGGAYFFLPGIRALRYLATAR